MPGKNNKCCCCDPCNTTRPTAVAGCCRCIPRRLCATFHADDPYCECDGAAVLLPKDGNDEYSGTLFCGADGMDIKVSLFTDSYGECFWRVESDDQGIDDLFAIDYGGESCESPTFSVEVSFYTCAGTVEISRHDHAKLPKRLENGRMVPFCGDCECVCQVLCVSRIRDGIRVTDEFAWDEGIVGWVWEYEQITLTHDDYDQCVLTMDGVAPVVIGCPDGIDAVFYKADPYDPPQSITAKCKQCHCGNEELTCLPCPEGTVYPWLVHLVIPSLGVDLVVGNEFDLEGDGETEYLYRWEGSDFGYTSQSYFGECEYGVLIIDESTGATVCSANAAVSDVVALSCPPEPLVIWYKVRCFGGAILDVYLIE